MLKFSYDQYKLVLITSKLNDVNNVYKKKKKKRFTANLRSFKFPISFSNRVCRINNKMFRIFEIERLQYLSMYTFFIDYTF